MHRCALLTSSIYSTVRCEVVAATTINSAVASQRRFQGRIPNKGYRAQPPVPDRLKDAMTLFGADAHNVTPDDPPYVPEEQRMHMTKEIMVSNQFMRNHAKLDRLRAALDTVHNEGPDHEGWQEVYLFLRTTEMCCELQKDATDVFPKGKKLWINLDECEEKRLPVLMEMPNGMLVLPVFSMEEYLDHYFGRVDAFESCWFPVPRMGTRYEEFCKLPFPVTAVGSIHHLSALATIALSSSQFGILVNPGQRTSKFLTYPEMVELAKQKRLRPKDRNTDLKRKSGDVVEDLYDRTLRCGFDTRKLVMRRVEPAEAAKLLLRRPKIPQVAQLELHLLLCDYETIINVFVRTTDRPQWRRVLGASEKLTQIDVVIEGGKPNREIFERIKKWSFMDEFHSDVHIEFAAAPPTAREGDGMMVVYDGADGKLLRSMKSFKGVTLRKALGYDEPLLDSHGRPVSFT
ncbi:uncharacterized protein TEOVI_000244900 [Trypanosoma equiperdum]|uniref:Uncharacterized protein n=4 Tax=Trypanozoon TaxID=39700 RepID=Q38DT7_TRYB2|nr:hypothetical protein, conserved [Trypanosoma brucei gambiense DAL972]XP_827363.1 hypothetical protein, conserved [Trypanosoma brucei brucei TREU927]RHW70248.1 hypothetical protein DPX39_090062400 [Trypanosoma brucei equiperdum]SCU70874.1 hypothetical protein, conserved [Trypanosoma equiperdum]EAN77033.1 hypothetical protein, conserved [Trypanosoma brucei brucei TREU927]CBH14561.1 hypothetical protein, conserved [Trypanosoma brucei gambiense DAL972]|eukprot:XP_011776827.1 hypothetical protein, conserved [Trypanosoma brucei gambiense DAL972]